MALRDILIKIAADATSVDKESRKAQAALKQLQRTAMDVGEKLAMAVSVPILGIGAAATKAFADIDSLKRGLTAVTGSAAEAERQFEALREVAKLPGLGLEEAARGATNLQALGFSAGQSQRILMEFGNALASVGRGREDLEEVIRQLGQMASRGKVTADNLKPIIERVPQVAGIIKKEFGTIDTEVLQKMGVSAEDLTNKILDSLSKLPRVTGGMKNEMENARDSVKIALSQIGEAIAPVAARMLQSFSEMVTSVANLAKGFRTLPEPVQNVTLVIAGIATGAPLAAIAIAKVIEAVTAVRAAFALLNATLIASPVGLAMLGLTAAGVAGYMVYDHYQKTAGAIDGVGEAAKKTAIPLEQNAEKLSELRTSAQGVNEALGVSVRVIGADAPKAHAAATVAAKAHAEAMWELPRATAWVNGPEGQAFLDYWSDYVKRSDASVDATRRYIESVGRAQDAQRSRAGHEQMDVNWGDWGAEARRRAEQAQIGTLPAPRNGAAEVIIDSWGRATKAAEKTKAVSREISTIWNDFSRGIAQAVVKWEGFGNLAKRTLQSIGEAVTRMLINKLLDATGIVGKLGGMLGGIIKNLGGAAASVGGSVAGAAGSAAGAVGGAASGAGSIAGGIISAGLMGTIGAVGAAITAVSSVISNFQLARQENTLNAIEWNTRKTSLHAEHSLTGPFNTYLPYLELVHKDLLGIIAMGGGGGAQVTINGGMMFAPGGERQFIDWLVQQLRLAGAIR